MLRRRDWWWQSTRELNAALWTQVVKVLLMLILLLLIIPLIRCSLHVLLVVRDRRSMLSEQNGYGRRLVRRVLLWHEQHLLLRNLRRIQVLEFLNGAIMCNVGMRWMVTKVCSFGQPLLLFLLLQNHYILHLLNWHCTFYVDPFPLNHMLVLELQYQIDTPNIGESDEAESSGLVRTLVL